MIVLLGRAACYVVTVMLLGVAVYSIAVSIDSIASFYYARDLSWYLDATRRFLDDGTWYRPRQLAGPYLIADGDVLYPPTVVWFFLPWLVLPPWLFVATPVVLTAWAIRRIRPAYWAWPLIAACLIWPGTWVKLGSGNPGIWLMAALALGTVYRWPAVFVILKPTVAPFAVIGIRSRGWWLAAAAIVLMTLPVARPAFEYPRVLLDAHGGGFYYSLWDLPMLLAPSFAWLGSLGRRKPSVTILGS